MTSTSELVERLRKGGLQYHTPSGPVYCGPTALEREAADAITTLERELEEATAAEPRVGAITAIADIREVTGLGAKPMLSELARAVQVLLSKYAHAAETAKAERDEAQLAASVIEGISNELDIALTASQAEVETLKDALKDAEKTIVEAAIPIEVQVAEGSAQVAPAVWDGLVNALWFIHAWLDRRAALQVEESKG